MPYNKFATAGSCVAALTVAILLPPHEEVQAQESAARAALEEITVTARRREENLQEIPISVFALGSEQLEIRNVQRTEDLNLLVPNVAIYGGGATGEGTGTFIVRGIPGVAVYIDGVWQATTDGLLTMNVVEMDRVEVLRGPQGTLFGKNTTGGAIQYVTRRPADEFGARVQLTTGEYNRRDVTMAVDLPLTDTLSTKFTGAQLSRDGFVQSQTIDRKYGDINDTIVRGDLLWTPNDNLSVRLTGDFTDIQRNGSARILASLQDVNTRVLTYNVAGFPYNSANYVAGAPGGRVGEFETRSDYENDGLVYDVERYTLDIEWALSESLTFKSITGYRELRNKIYTDFDAAEISLIEDDRRRKQEQTTQEFQIQGTSGDRFSWVAGVYYWNEEAIQRQMRWTFDEFRTGELDFSLVEAAFPGFALRPPSSDSTDGDETTGVAIFGEATIGLTDRLDLTVGVRQNEEEIEEFSIITTGAEMPARPDTDPVGDLFVGEKQVAGEADFDSFTPRVSLQYQWNDNLMTYVSFAEGFGAGGININEVLGIVPFDEETLENFEIGLRSDLLDDRFRFNATLFTSTWKGIQLSESPPDPDNPGLFLPNPLTRNAGEAEVDGVEFELLYAPSEAWQLDFNLGWLDARYTDVGRTNQITLGSRFQYAPEYTASIGGQYNASLTNGGSVVARLDYGWTDDYDRSQELRRQSLQPSYGLLSARVNYEPAGRDWRLSVFGTNLTEERYLNSGFVSGGFGFDLATVGRPREVGATMQFFFD